MPAFFLEAEREIFFPCLSELPKAAAILGLWPLPTSDLFDLCSCFYFLLVLLRDFLFVFWLETHSYVLVTSFFYQYGTSVPFKCFRLEFFFKS